MNKDISIFDTFLNSKFAQISKYILASVLMYIAVSGFLFLAVSVLNLPEVASYVVIYLVAYIIDYIINLKYIFSSKHNSWMILRYSSHVGFFYLINIGLFKLLLSFEVNYMLATWGIVILLFPLRYLSYKFFVYRKWDNGAHSRTN